MLAGLEPGLTPQPGDVEQHAAADEAVLERLDATDRGAREVIPAAGWPLYRQPSNATWHSASMWL